MIVKVRKRKAGSLKELAFYEYKIKKADNLEELLYQITLAEIEKLKQRTDNVPEEQIGKITFGLYDGKTTTVEDSMKTARQDFVDGLFRVFWNGEECAEWNAPIACAEENELVIIRLVMMAGRLW